MIELSDYIDYDDYCKESDESSIEHENDDTVDSRVKLSDDVVPNPISDLDFILSIQNDNIPFPGIEISQSEGNIIISTDDVNKDNIHRNSSDDDNSDDDADSDGDSENDYGNKSMSNIDTWLSEDEIAIEYNSNANVPIKSKNELVETNIPIPNEPYVNPKNETMLYIGNVTCRINSDCTILVQSVETNRPLNEGSVLLLSNGLAIGMFDTISN